MKDWRNIKTKFTSCKVSHALDILKSFYFTLGKGILRQQPLTVSWIHGSWSDWMETCDKAEHQTASSISNIIVPSDIYRVDRYIKFPVFQCICLVQFAIFVMHCRCKMICYNYFHHKSWKQKIINCAQLSKQITAPVVISPPHHGSHGGSHHTLSEIMDPPIFPAPGVPPRLSRVRNQFSLICTQPAPASTKSLSSAKLFKFLFCQNGSFRFQIQFNLKISSEPIGCIQK